MFKQTIPEKQSVFQQAITSLLQTLDIVSTSLV